MSRNYTVEGDLISIPSLLLINGLDQLIGKRTVTYRCTS
jgi:hypothetical protein